MCVACCCWCCVFAVVLLVAYLGCCLWVAVCCSLFPRFGKVALVVHHWRSSFDVCVGCCLRYVVCGASCIACCWMLFMVVWYVLSVGVGGLSFDSLFKVC